jgi:hypothetical protein
MSGREEEESRGEAASFFIAPRDEHGHGGMGLVERTPIPRRVYIREC